MAISISLLCKLWLTRRDQKVLGLA